MLLKTVVLCGFLALASGVPADDIDSRIVGGKDAAAGQFPYMASLRTDNQHFCGGTIISNRTILTAAHCEVGPIISMTAVVGSISLGGGGVAHRVSRFIKHPGWNPDTLENDVALIILNIDITFTENIQPIALPTYNIGDDVAVTASGWGLTSYPSELPSNKLQYLTTRTISAAKCRSLHSGSLFNSQICTLTKAGQGVCSGDSGGPIVAKNMVQGVASAAYLCALGLPDFFTRVVLFNPWIKQNMVN